MQHHKSALISLCRTAVALAAATGATGITGCLFEQNATLSLPVIVSQPPASLIANIGAAAKIGLAVTGKKLSYTWIKNGSDTVGTADTLMLANLDFADSGSYICVVRNKVGADTSSAAFLHIADPFPGIIVQPAALTVAPYDVAMFTVIAKGTNLAYRWVRGESDTLPGQYSPTLTITQVPESFDSLTYKCVVRNTYGTVVSNSVRLRVDVPRQTLIDSGEVVFQNCAACHRLNGRGYAGTIPPLANADFFLANRRRTIEIVLGGHSDSLFVNGLWYDGDMPAWADALDNTQIAAVLTYLRVVRNDSTVVSCNSNTLDESGFAICQKTPRSPAALSMDSVSIREVRDLRESMFPL